MALIMFFTSYKIAITSVHAHMVHMVGIQDYMYINNTNIAGRGKCPGSGIACCIFLNLHLLNISNNKITLPCHTIVIHDTIL